MQTIYMSIIHIISYSYYALDYEDVSIHINTVILYICTSESTLPKLTYNGASAKETKKKVDRIIR